jgi:hypothetical protein
MSNWFYILVRTFPFWAIPIGLALVATGLRRKGKKLFLLIGLILIAGGVSFLFAYGHFLAVPWVHEMWNTPSAPGNSAL